MSASATTSFLGGHVAGASIRPHRRGRHDRRACRPLREDIIPFGFAYGQIGSAGRAQHRRVAPARRDARANCISCGAPIAALFLGEGRIRRAHRRRSRGVRRRSVGGKDHCVHPRRAAGGRLMRPRAKHAADGGAAMPTEERAATGPQDPGAAAVGEPIAIICGGGSFPGAVAEAIARRGRRPVMFRRQGLGRSQGGRALCASLDRHRAGGTFLPPRPRRRVPRRACSSARCCGRRLRRSASTGRSLAADAARRAFLSRRRRPPAFRHWPR